MRRLFFIFVAMNAWKKLLLGLILITTGLFVFELVRLFTAESFQVAHISKSLVYLFVLIHLILLSAHLNLGPKGNFVFVLIGLIALGELIVMYVNRTMIEQCWKSFFGLLALQAGLLIFRAIPVGSTLSIISKWLTLFALVCIEAILLFEISMPLVHTSTLLLLVVVLLFAGFSITLDKKTN